MPIHTGRLEQTHHRRRPLARTQAASERPIDSANGDGDTVVHQHHHAVSALVGEQLDVAGWAAPKR